MCDRTNYLLSVYALISSISLMLSGVWIFLAMGTLAQEDMFKDRAEITKKLQYDGPETRYNNWANHLSQ